MRRRLFVLALVVGATACGGASRGDEAAPVATTAEVTSAATTATTATTATVTNPSTLATQAPTTTTLPPTTYTLPTTIPLPTPAPPPLDDEAEEPVVPLGSIAIPAIGIDATLYEGIRLPTFDLGPGHWPGTAMPGQAGNMVIGGHRTESNADFGDLDLLQPGNEVIVTDGAGTSFTYLVESTEITDPFAARLINQTPEKTATLFACHPKGSTDRRIVVHLSLSV